MAIFTLDGKGVLLALVFGILLWFLGLGLGYFMVLESFIFIAVAAVVTDLGTGFKKHMGTYQRERGMKNVFANGIAPLFMAFGFFISSLYLQQGHLNLLFLVAFIGSVAAVTADKFGSEVGVFGGRPVMIIGLKRVRIGTSGGVTALGLLAGLVAAIIMVLPAFMIAGFVNGATMPPVPRTGVQAPMPILSMPMLALIAAVVAGGFLGNVADSVLGYFEEKKIGNKYTSNFLSSVIGGIVSMLVFWAIALV
jgi:uncharacterized protein (TIGR00297 family)